MTGVLVVGDLLVDVVAEAGAPLARGSDTPARVAWAGGGAAANVAAWLAHDGVPVCLVTRVGDDVAGRAAVAELTEAGVDVRAAVDPARPTGTCVVLVEPGGERSMLPDRGAAGALAPADLPDAAFTAGAHLHLSGYALLHDGSRAAGLAALERARGAGMTVSVDPASAAPLRACGRAVVLGWLAGTDLLLPNREEAEVLTGLADPAQAARALVRDAGVREVVVTLGAEGALWTDGAAVLRAEAVRAAAARDSTGAGDAFAAGWLAARLGGAAPDVALRAGVARGAQAVGLAGARPAGRRRGDVRPGE